MLRSAAFVFDIDGTLDTFKGSIYPPVIRLLAEWLTRGADLLFITNRTSSWVGANVLTPVGNAISGNAVGRVFVACEQGAEISQAIIRPLANGCTCTFLPLVVWTLTNIPDIRDAVRAAACKEGIEGSSREHVRHQVCYELKQPFRGVPEKWLPRRLAEQTRVIQTRSTITFISHRAGKAVALRWLMHNIQGLHNRNFLGFGDDGDEFASVVPTVDVDRHRRMSFDRPGYQFVAAHDPALFRKLGIRRAVSSGQVTDGLAAGGGIATSTILSTMLNAQK